uniref:Uncharacterized protein n=1 Tax=Physcomitrium patens TaxID=3218 RepID=A0A7I4C858_PHYPA
MSQGDVRAKGFPAVLSQLYSRIPSVGH